MLLETSKLLWLDGRMGKAMATSHPCSAPPTPHPAHASGLDGEATAMDFSAYQSDITLSLFVRGLDRTRVRKHQGRLKVSRLSCGRRCGGQLSLVLEHLGFMHVRERGMLGTLSDNFSFAPTASTSWTAGEGLALHSSALKIWVEIDPSFGCRRTDWKAPQRMSGAATFGARTRATTCDLP